MFDDTINSNITSQFNRSLLWFLSFDLIEVSSKLLTHVSSIAWLFNVQAKARIFRLNVFVVSFQLYLKLEYKNNLLLFWFLSSISDGGCIFSRSRGIRHRQIQCVELYKRVFNLFGFVAGFFVFFSFAMPFHRPHACDFGYS